MIKVNFYEERTRTILFYSIVFLLTSIFFIPEKNLHLKLFILFIAISFPLMVAKGLCRWKAIFESRIFLTSTLFLAFSLLSLFWSTPTRSSDILNPIKNIFYLLSFWFIFLFAFNDIDRRIQILVKWLIIVGSITAISYATYQYFYLNHSLATRFTIPGPMLDKVRTGICLGAGALICMASLLFEPNNRRPRSSVLLLIAFAIFLVTMLLTHTRLAIAATLFFSFIMITLSPLEKRNKLLLAVFGIISLFAASFFLAPLLDAYINRGPSLRLTIWSGFLNEYNQYWFGHGLGTEIQISEGKLAGFHSYHSIYLGALLSSGIIGLGLLLLMISITLFTGWKLRANPYALIATILFAYSCTTGLVNFDTVISRPRGYWLPFWLPIIVLSVYELKSSERKVST